MTFKNQGVEIKEKKEEGMPGGWETTNGKETHVVSVSK
jgi:hypothetical protein